MKKFQPALALDPRNAGAEYEIGEIYRRRSQPQQAASHFATAVEIDPRFEDAQIALARTLIGPQQPSESGIYLQRDSKLLAFLQGDCFGKKERCFISVALQLVR